MCIECSIDEYQRNKKEAKCDSCGEGLKYSGEDVETRECLSCVIKNKQCNSKVLAREN